jgi:hypothetical protein
MSVLMQIEGYVLAEDSRSLAPVAIRDITSRHVERDVTVPFRVGGSYKVGHLTRKEVAGCGHVAKLMLPNINCYVKYPIYTVMCLHHLLYMIFTSFEHAQNYLCLRECWIAI